MEKVSLHNINLVATIVRQSKSCLTTTSFFSRPLSTFSCDNTSAFVVVDFLSYLSIYSMKNCHHHHLDQIIVLCYPAVIFIDNCILYGILLALTAKDTFQFRRRTQSNLNGKSYISDSFSVFFHFFSLPFSTK